MTRTYTHRALACVVNEREHVSEKSDAFEEFRRSVSAIGSSARPRDARTTARSPVGHGPPGKRRGSSAGKNARGCTRVLESFCETVRPEAVEDLDEPETVMETVAEELGDCVAYSLSPETEVVFDEGLKSAVLSAVTDRQAELRAMEKAVRSEEESVKASVETIERLVEALEEADEADLFGLGFDELEAAYEELSGFESECERGIRARQEVLQGTTKNGAAGLEHPELVAYLYQDLPTDHPVLFTLTRLNRLCDELQDRVRDQIARTV